jgi:hypothetical protein
VAHVVVGANACPFIVLEREQKCKTNFRSAAQHLGIVEEFAFAAKRRKNVARWGKPRVVITTF